MAIPNFNAFLQTLKNVTKTTPKQSSVDSGPVRYEAETVENERGELNGG
jgi:hypothetical protein